MAEVHVRQVVSSQPGEVLTSTIEHALRVRDYNRGAGYSTYLEHNDTTVEVLGMDTASSLSAKWSQARSKTDASPSVLTPAAHYAEAERLLGKISDVPTTREDGGPLPWEVTATSISTLVAHAQVHATLATAPSSVPPALAVLLTTQEKGVLLDAIRSDREIRNDTGVRASLLASAAKKIGLEL